MTANIKDQICIGTVIDAHGLQGSVRVRVYSDDPQGLLKYKYFKDKFGQIYNIKTLRFIKGDMVSVKFSEFNDRNAVEGLKGLELFILHNQLPSLEQDDFYISDLIGLKVKIADGTVIGEVKLVENHGAGDFLTISSKPVNCVPFIREAVPDVCIKDGYIVVNADYLDLPKEN